MTFNELVANVILSTNRPDLDFVANGGDGQIPQIVLSTTLAVHSIDHFYKDIVESDILFDTPAYLQTLDTTTLTRFRSLAYFRKWDIAEGIDGSGNLINGYGAYGNWQFPPPPPTPSNVSDLDGGTTLFQPLGTRMLDIVDTKSMFDSYGLVKPDICYSAGNTIRLKSSTLLSVGKIGYYSYPDLDISNNGANYSSWVANEYPYAIIWNAVAMVNSATGNLDAAKNLLRPGNSRTGDPGGLAFQAIEALKQGNIELGGR